MMESTYLKTVVEVVRCGSFTKAASALNVSQSAVSKRIKFLEDRYGRPLIDRSGPLLVPTEAGRLIYNMASRMLELERELAGELQKLNERSSLQFACSRPFGMTLLPAVMKEFMAGHGDKVDIRVNFLPPTQALAGLRENRHDIAVVEHWDRIDFSPHPSLPLGRDEMVFISSPRLGLTAPLVTLDELVRQRLYRRSDDCCSGRMLAFNMAGIGRNPSEFVQVQLYDDLHAIIDLVRMGEGIAFISKSLVAAQLESGSILAHTVEGFCHTRHRTLVYRDEILHNRSLTDFIASLRSIAG